MPPQLAATRTQAATARVAISGTGTRAHNAQATSTPRKIAECALPPMTTTPPATSRAQCRQIAVVTPKLSRVTRTQAARVSAATNGPIKHATLVPRGSIFLSIVALAPRVTQITLRAPAYAPTTPTAAVMRRPSQGFTPIVNAPAATPGVQPPTAAHAPHSTTPTMTATTATLGTQECTPLATQTAPSRLLAMETPTRSVGRW